MRINKILIFHSHCTDFAGIMESGVYTAWAWQRV